MRKAQALMGIAAVSIGMGCSTSLDTDSSNIGRSPTEVSASHDAASGHGGNGKEATTLYVWASDQAHVAPDFLAVIDFDRKSSNYGKVLKTVPLPPPGNIGNEPHHCHTSVDQNILACGGLLSVLKGQNDIFFFDISDARSPRFVSSTHAPQSSITDDFLSLPGGGFLVTNMGSASGGPGGRVVEVNAKLKVVGEFPSVLPADGKFNPHGMDADFSRNQLVTSDFVNPASTLNVVPGGLELRSSLRFWNLASRTITRSVFLPDDAGTMDVKFIPGDEHGRAVTVNMFTGLMYSVDPTNGTYAQAFDMSDVRPHVDTPVPGGMPGLIAVPRGGRTLITATFMAGQVVMLDISNPRKFKQLDVVSFGANTGPHSVHLTHDDKRLVVTDYFLNEDGIGKVHLEGDHKLHVLDVGEKRLTVDQDFRVVNFNTAFATGPARPHGIGMK
ncbi:MAG: selenium-binding protein SBP56-related protein [bacterium]